MCLTHTLPVGAPDVHEQKKPWVPLMLEASYRPSGWLGIMCVPAAGRGAPRLPALGACPHAVAAVAAALVRRLGSRLYFAFTGAVLGDGAAWEGLADGVAVEVRRHGAAPPESRRSAPAAPPAPAEAVAQDGVGEAAAAPAARVVTPTALATPLPTRGAAAPAGVGASSVVHVDNHSTISHNTTIANSSSNSNSNVGNTFSSVVLL